MRRGRSLVADLEALARKYRALVTLRRARERLEARGVFRLTGAAGERRRLASQRLARRFPGALKELDLLSSQVLAGRLADVEHELRAARRGERGRVAWVPVMLDYHAALRQGLAIKRSRAGRSKVAASVARPRA